MLQKVEKAYIAGFLDGDGCIMFQLVRRKDYIFGYQVRASIVFYQKRRNRMILEWFKDKLSDGYIRDRNDGMSEYTIVGFSPTTKVLKLLLPYLRLKRDQAVLALKVAKRMPGSGKGKKISPKLLFELAGTVDLFSVLNYSKKRVNTQSVVYQFLKSHNLFDPVETDP